jgi:predicted DNA-binding ribbon-helix-helix protein
MSAFTVRLSDEKHERLRALAQSRGTTLNRLIDEMTTMMLANHRSEHDTKGRFRLRALRGAGKMARGLALLKEAAG